MATYKNPWHDKNTNLYGPAFYSTDAKPTEYRGYLIYKRIAFDVVKGGVCVGCYGGMRGAKGFVDKLHGEGDPDLVKFAQERVAEYFA